MRLAIMIATCCCTALLSTRTTTAFLGAAASSSPTLLVVRPAATQHRPAGVVLRMQPPPDENDDSKDKVVVLWREVPKEDEPSAEQQERRNATINVVTASLLVAIGVSLAELFATSVYTPPGFQRLPQMQYIAALGDPNASQGTTTITQQPWGLWTQDPGPRGVWLRDYDDDDDNIQNNKTPAGWTMDPNDFWLDEHGILMERPTFPLPPGRYLVSGGRWVTTGLTIADDDETGSNNWKLDDGHTLYEVTHLPCRAARYTGGSGCSPKTADPSAFPVKQPGAPMPPVDGCSKQDYAVLLLVGKADS